MASDTEEMEMPEGDVDIDNPSAAAEASLAKSSMGSMHQRQESIAQMLVEDENLEKLTNLFSREEPRTYAKMQYLLALVNTVGKQDQKGFLFPDFTANLVRPDFQLRTSVKQQTRKILESITKIFERGGESSRRPGLLGRR